MRTFYSFDVGHSTPTVTLLICGLVALSAPIDSSLAQDYSYYYQGELVPLVPSADLVVVSNAGFPGFSNEAGLGGMQRQALSNHEVLQSRNLAVYRLPRGARVDLGAAMRTFAESSTQEVQPVFEQGSSLLIPSNELIVAFDTPTDEAGARQRLQPHLEQHGIEDVRAARGDSFILTISNPSNGRVYAVCQVLHSVDGIRLAEPNHIVVFLDPNEGPSVPLGALGDLPGLTGSSARPAPRTMNAARASVAHTVGWATIVEEDFESASLPSGWATDRKDTTVADVKWNVTNQRSHSGTRSAYATGGGSAGIAAPGDYPNDVVNWLASPSMDLSGFEEVYVELWFYGKFGTNTNSAFDFGAVLLHDLSSDTFAVAEGAGPMYVGYTGDLTADPTTDSGWRRALYRVPPSMRADNVRAEIWFGADASGSAEGLYVDEVRIVGSTDVDVEPIGNDVYAGRLYEMQNTGQLAGNGTRTNDMQIPEAWEVVSPASHVVVAVVDSGVDLNHPDLSLVPGFDPDGSGDGRARGSHGTAVAGNVGATGNNSLGVLGTAPGVSIMPVYRGGNFNEFAGAIDVAVENGADIISNSWGWVGAPSATIEAAIRDALAADVTVLFAAGNGPDRSPFTYDVAFPGSLTATTDIITVGASSPTDEHKAAASSDGVFSWGSSYVGAGPDVVAPSPWSYTTDIQGSGGYHDGTSLPEQTDSADYTPYFGGTSSATPKVAGVAALMLSANPRLRPNQVKSILMDTADDIDAPNNDDKTGAGRVNAHRAVTQAVHSTALSMRELRFVPISNFVLDGDNAGFQIRVICDDAFDMRSLIITARDATRSVRVRYNGARILSNPFGSALTPPSGWTVAHSDYSVSVGSNSAGDELLSSMEIPSLGIPRNASFDIFGDRSPNTNVTTLTIGAAVETTIDPDNECRVVVVDF